MKDDNRTRYRKQYGSTYLLERTPQWNATRPVLSPITRSGRMRDQSASRRTGSGDPVLGLLTRFAGTLIDPAFCLIALLETRPGAWRSTEAYVPANKYSRTVSCTASGCHPSLAPLRRGNSADRARAVHTEAWSVGK